MGMLGPPDLGLLDVRNRAERAPRRQLPEEGVERRGDDVEVLGERDVDAEAYGEEEVRPVEEPVQGLRRRGREAGGAERRADVAGDGRGGGELRRARAVEIGDGGGVHLGRRDDGDLGQLMEQHQRRRRHQDEAGLVALEPFEPLGASDPPPHHRPSDRSEHQYGEDVEPGEKELQPGGREHEGRVAGVDGVEDEEETVADQLRHEAPEDDEVADAGEVAPAPRHAHQHAPLPEHDQDHAEQALEGAVEPRVFTLAEQHRRDEPRVDTVGAGSGANCADDEDRDPEGKYAEQVAGDNHPGAIRSRSAVTKGEARPSGPWRYFNTSLRGSWATPSREGAVAFGCPLSVSPRGGEV